MPEPVHAREIVLDDEERLDLLEESVAVMLSELAELKAVVDGLVSQGF